MGRKILRFLIFISYSLLFSLQTYPPNLILNTGEEIRTTPKNANIDTDGDGYIDSVDLDDDNDGILDSVEEAQCNAAFSTTVFGPNITVNPGFESGNVNFISELMYFGDCTANTVDQNVDLYSVTTTDARDCHSNWLGDPQEGTRFALFNFPTTTKNFWCQTLAVEPNQVYFFSAFFINLVPGFNPGETPVFSFTVTDDSSGNAVDLGRSDAQIDLSLHQNGWQEAGFAYTTLPGATTITICLRNASFALFGNDAGMDNIRLRTVYCDSDNDGIANIHDLDSDNDGIYDVIEVGNPAVIDANNDGRADGPVDTNGIPISASGGIIIPVNTDRTASPDYIDIDSDNDGIQDNIEGQETFNYRAPSGNDLDLNGVDDQYDMGNTPITPTDTDGDLTPDYIDLNSDNDCLGDGIEAHDTNNDGIADTLPIGADTDNDGLDNAYDQIVLGPGTAITNPTDGNELPTALPDNQNPGNDVDFRDAFDVADAGTNGSVTLCDSGTSVDLFDSLGGNPDPGGNWSPMLTSGTGVFDPATDSDGVYTYTIAATGACPEVSAQVTVTVTNSPDAGTNGSITLCEDSMSVNLFDSLGGTPDTGGNWSPLLTSGTGIFDPAVDMAGIYTYTIAANNNCPEASAQVMVTITDSPDAGSNSSITLCEDDLPANLFDALGGTPDTGGTWSPSLTSGTGIFDPTLDMAGVYLYTIAAIGSCPEVTAEVTVTITESPNAGSDGEATLCTNDTSVNLFDSLGGNPDPGGTWSPILSSGTGVFDPATDTAGVYTYTTNTMNCIDTATVDVTVIMPPQLTGSITSCAADLRTYAVQLTINPTTPTITSNLGTVSGTRITDIPMGMDVSITLETNGCSELFVIMAPDCNCPIINDPTNPNNPSICEGEATPPLQVAPPATGNEIQWYDSLTSTDILFRGNTFTPLDVNVGIFTYYAETIATGSNCSSSRIPVTLTIIESPIVDILPDVSACGSYILPPLNAGSYFSEPNGGGTTYLEGTEITTSQPIYIFNATGDMISCSDESSFMVTITDIVSITLESGAICETAGDTEVIELDTFLNPNEYTFTWRRNGQLIPGENEPAIMVSNPGEYTVLYTNTTNSACFGSASASIESVPGPQGLSLSLTNGQFANRNSILATVMSPGNYEYILDGNISQESNLFEDVPFGLHEVTAISLDGCGEITEEIFVIGFPNFFTPNGDNINDYWNVIANAEVPEMDIFIFDRYGKLIKVITPNDQGWNGTYNNQPLPATDYWFTAQLRDGSATYQSHFTLRR